MPREASLTISDSMEKGSPVESEVVSVVSRSTTKITEQTSFKKKENQDLQAPDTLNIKYIRTMMVQQKGPGRGVLMRLKPVINPFQSFWLTTGCTQRDNDF